MAERDVVRRISSVTGTNPIQEIDFEVSCVVKSIK
jgi:hypothetical protein